MPETTTETATTETGSAVEGTQEQFSQADIDKIVSKVRGEERRKASEKYADYDDLKTKADGAKTVEQQLADLQGQLSASNARALRSDIAAAHGISAEDRDLFLTGTDEESLTRQAKALAAKDTDRKKHGNVAPREGGTKKTGDAKTDMREFTRGLFGDAD